MATSYGIKDLHLIGEVEELLSFTQENQNTGNRKLKCVPCLPILPDYE